MLHCAGSHADRLNLPAKPGQPAAFTQNFSEGFYVSGNAESLGMTDKDYVMTVDTRPDILRPNHCEIRA
jgi:hypothetical protein